MVAQVAAEEPETAAKIPQPTTFTCMSRPGSHCSHGERPRNICSERRVRKRISPIQMKSGRAVSVQEAELAQTVVASTEPIGTFATIVIAAKPTARRARPIHRPPASSAIRMQRSTTAVPTRPRSPNIRSDPALDGALDHLLDRLRLRLLVAGRMAREHMDELVHEGDEQNHEPDRVAELREPHRHRDHALRDVVEAPGLVIHAHRLPGEEADEGGAEEEAGDLDEAAGPAFEAVYDEADADDLARFEGVGKAQEGEGGHAPSREIVPRRDVEVDLAPERQRHHQPEDRDQEQPRKIAGREIKAVEEASDHLD